MEMDIDLSCSGCVARVFTAIGRVMHECPGSENISAVYVFEAEEAVGGVAATISWEFSPDREMVRVFRAIWDEETEFVQCVLNHESPACRPDVPSLVEDCYSRN